MEKTLFEHRIIESETFDALADPVAPPGPRTNQPSPATPNAPTEHPIGTKSQDIALQAPKVLLAQNSISASLPYMIGFVQPLESSVGYVFGLQKKNKTKIGVASDDDYVVMRKLVETQVREVVLDLTNETAEDIQNLFGDNFPLNYDRFIKSGGVLWDGPNGPLARFFLSMARQRITAKTNKDFTDWIEKVATLKGATTIAAWDKMEELVGVIAELREALYKGTGKSGQYWILVSPKIAAFLSTYYGTQYNDANILQDGARKPRGIEGGYVSTIGDIDVYQYDFYKTPAVTGGTKADSESDGKIYMGYRGSAGTSSVYYMPYNETIIQGGESYFDGQSNVFYRVRDAWELNPLDTFDGSIDDPNIGTAPQPDLTETNKSSFIVQADITFSTKLIN